VVAGFLASDLAGWRMRLQTPLEAFGLAGALLGSTSQEAGTTGTSGRSGVADVEELFSFFFIGGLYC
jgi:hypothetical protein